MAGALTAAHLAVPAATLELPGYARSIARAGDVPLASCSSVRPSSGSVGSRSFRHVQCSSRVGQLEPIAPTGTRSMGRTVPQTSTQGPSPALGHSSFLPAVASAPGRRGDLQVVSARVASDGQKWWEKEGLENMKDLHSTQEFVEALSSGGDNLIVVEFFATWCGSCRALFPKLCQIAGQHPEIQFYKVNFDENKPMCKSLNIKVLPYFHFYRGSEGRLDAFSASISKLQRLRDAIATHSTDRCSLGPVAGEKDLVLADAASSASSSAENSAPASAQ